MADDASIIEQLALAGFLAPDHDARALTTAASDAASLAALLERRLSGEPLAWIVGHMTFAGSRLEIDPGVYVPRPHSEPFALRAAALVPDDGVAVDLCTGSGAVAAVIARARPAARIVATDLSAPAVGCARRNGVDALLGDLFGPLPDELRGRVDVVTGVVPYVPDGALGLLQRDTFTFESVLAYAGGADGLDVLRRVATGAAIWLRPRGSLLLELGGTQSGPLGELLGRLGYRAIEVVVDEEGDDRWIEAIRG